MPLHYVRRQDLSKYTLKSFDSANEIMCDTNNSDTLTLNKNGTIVTLSDSTTAQATTSNVEIIGAITGGAGSSSYSILKTVTIAANNTATAIATVTIPNPTVNSNAAIIVQVLGVVGTGGAIGVGESSAAAMYVMSVARTVGAVAVITTGTVFGSAVSKVSGGDTFTTTIAASSVTGASTVTETFTINATCNDSTNSGATNHLVVAYIQVINAAAGGVSIA